MKKRDFKNNKKSKSNKKKKGFTLMELLAVIVILGLFVAIAIPSITKYITQSKRKTVVSSIDGYIASAVNAVNDQDYKFTTPNTIYAIPIECVSIEKGGDSPFGEWMQANDNYWAYVLVQYDSTNFSYNYGFTFKDSSGYGMYPTSQVEINPKSTTQIKTGLELKRPTSGLYTNIAEKDKWTGFIIDDDTKLIVLEANLEGVGDGVNTCTLCQKGNNYEEVEKEINMRLSNLIKENNSNVCNNPDLTKTSAVKEKSLCVSNATNNGKPTYYFRGDVTNNYVSFAGFTWRIIRINEDNTIRLILNTGINDKKGYQFNTSPTNYQSIYYSNSDVTKKEVDEWYETNITSKGYDDYVATGIFCEQAKVKYSDDYTSGNADMVVYTEYTPNFKCTTDGNGYGILKAKVGLITVDEVLYSGGYFDTSNTYTYLFNGGNSFWTMSPGGLGIYYATEWSLYNAVNTSPQHITERYYNVRPVINLNANVLATGSGTFSDPYEVITK